MSVGAAVRFWMLLGRRCSGNRRFRSRVRVNGAKVDKVGAASWQECWILCEVMWGPVFVGCGVLVGALGSELWLCACGVLGVGQVIRWSAGSRGQIVVEQRVTGREVERGVCVCVNRCAVDAWWCVCGCDCVVLRVGLSDEPHGPER